MLERIYCFLSLWTIVWRRWKIWVCFHLTKERESTSLWVQTPLAGREYWTLSQLLCKHKNMLWTTEILPKVCIIAYILRELVTLRHDDEAKTSSPLSYIWHLAVVTVSSFMQGLFVQNCCQMIIKFQEYSIAWWNEPQSSGIKNVNETYWF